MLCFLYFLVWIVYDVIHNAADQHRSAYESRSIHKFLDHRIFSVCWLHDFPLRSRAWFECISYVIRKRFHENECDSVDHFFDRRDVDFLHLFFFVFISVHFFEIVRWASSMFFSIMIIERISRDLFSMYNRVLFFRTFFVFSSSSCELCSSSFRSRDFPFRTSRISCVDSWLTNRMHWFDVSSHMFRTRWEFDIISSCVRICDNLYTAASCNFWWIFHTVSSRSSRWILRSTVN